MNRGFGLSGCMQARFNSMKDFPFLLLLAHPDEFHPGFTSGLDGIISYFTSLPCTAPQIHLSLRDFKSLRVSGQDSSDSLCCLLLPLLLGVVLCLFQQSSGPLLSTVLTRRTHPAQIKDSHSVLLTLLGLIHHFSPLPWRKDVTLSTTFAAVISLIKTKWFVTLSPHSLAK